MRCDEPRSNAPRNVPSAYPSQSTPLPQTTMLLGGRPKRPKGIEALAAFKRSDEKDRAAQWIFCASSIGGIEFIPKCLFKIEGWGSSVGVSNGNKLEIDVYEEVVRAQA